MADPQGAGSDIFGQGPNPSLGAQSQAGNNRSEKQVNKQEDYTNMYQQVQQFKEDEHQKKLANQDQKARLNEDLRRQIEENKRIKDAKERDEKNRDAALQREHDRILLDREAQRNSVCFSLSAEAASGPKNSPTSTSPSQRL